MKTEKWFEEQLKRTPKEKFVSLMEKTIDHIKIIDDETPYESVEPDWWLDMMDIQRKMRQSLEKIKASTLYNHNLK